MEWNVVVTTHDEGFERAEAELEDFGRVARTGYFNVLVMEVDDADVFLEDLSDRAVLIPDLFETVIARVTPVTHSFTFQDVEEFERKGARVARTLAVELAGTAFYVRVHRRGMKGELASDEAERAVADAVFESLEERKLSAEVDFDDPDAVLVVETVDSRAGLGLLRRAELERFPVLHPG